MRQFCEFETIVTHQGNQKLLQDIVERYVIRSLFHWNYYCVSDDNLIHLDPHYCQEVVNVWEPDFPLSSFHCRSPRKMNLSRLDPSCCIGFYCRTRDDFYKFMQSVRQVRKQIWFLFCLSCDVSSDLKTCRKDFWSLSSKSS